MWRIYTVCTNHQKKVYTSLYIFHQLSEIRFEPNNLLIFKINPALFLINRKIWLIKIVFKELFRIQIYTGCLPKIRVLSMLDLRGIPIEALQTLKKE